MGEEQQVPIPSIYDQNECTTQVAETSTQGPLSSAQQVDKSSKPVGSLGICPKCKDRPAEVSFSCCRFHCRRRPLSHFIISQ
jgi:hypothetical protein